MDDCFVEILVSIRWWCRVGHGNGIRFDIPTPFSILLLHDCVRIAVSHHIVIENAIG